jgi:SOS response regulatory protein OraA/RecX
MITEAHDMTEDEINKVVSKLLRERFKDFKFVRSTVQSQQDFDGSSVLRVTAHFKKRDVPSDRLTAAMHDIRAKLIDMGEERFVFLDSEYPEKEVVEEDVD